MPNVQNLPIRDPAYKDIRRAIAAPPDTGGVLLDDTFVMVECDLSQVELRTLAQASGDPVLIDAFQRGTDLHTATARELFPEVGLIDYILRQIGKTCNFGLSYGASAGKLFEVCMTAGYPITMGKAAAMHRALQERYARLEEYRAEQHAVVLRTNEVHTLFGRVRMFPVIATMRQGELAAALREAFATIPQGTAADLFKVWLVLIDKAGLFDHTGGVTLRRRRLVNVVHDSVVAYVPRKEAGQWAEAVCKQASETPYRASEVMIGLERTKWWGGVRDWQVPILAEAKAGQNWAELEGV